MEYELEARMVGWMDFQWVAMRGCMLVAEMATH